MKKKLEGIIPPIITPFREDGTIDLKLAEKEMKISLDAGVDGLSVAEVPERVPHCGTKNWRN